MNPRMILSGLSTTTGCGRRPEIPAERALAVTLSVIWLASFSCALEERLPWRMNPMVGPLPMNLPETSPVADLTAAFVRLESLAAEILRAFAMMASSIVMRAKPARMLRPAIHTVNGTNVTSGVGR
jgi:hypothetical protein